jgi:hypothetical protein
MSKDTTHCQGCSENFYNGNNPLGVTQCWHLKSARIVNRWRLGWWTAPTVPRALVQVKTYDCHRESGRYAFSKELPTCAVDPQYLPKQKRIQP